MKNYILWAALLGVFSLIVVASCKKDEDDSTVGALEFKFEHRAGAEALVFNKDYTLASGETARFTKVKYYLSNFVLVKDDGTEVVVPKDKSYFLLDHEIPSSLIFKVDSVPLGSYKGLKFIIGVDSAKSTAPVNQRKGVLDEAGAGGDMYWTWNSGYIFIKVEGSTPQTPFQFHIGGYGGYNPAAPTINNIKQVNLTVPDQSAVVHSGQTSHFHLFVDILEFFKNPNTIRIEDNPYVHFTPGSTAIADNYADMFRIEYVKNHE